MEASKDLIIFNLSHALKNVMARFKPEVGDEAAPAADQLMWTQCELALNQARGNRLQVPDVSNLLKDSTIKWEVTTRSGTGYATTVHGDVLYEITVCRGQQSAVTLCISRPAVDVIACRDDDSDNVHDTVPSQPSLLFYKAYPCNDDNILSVYTTVLTAAEAYYAAH